MATETKIESTLWERFTDKLGAITEGIVGFLTDLILGGPPDAGWPERVQAACAESPADATFARRAAIAVLASPEAQLS